ncbi:hypothetical protein JAAARDRAFT_200927 [Jaapia argillacea MUCL 33604]|uniref:Uncharacterized protein n=1 Tax=Jaapia argillacea MUCL 33604 TaxID=933084 RepID=A0A067P3J2_9AGAM|nr:hypothetical protein JAAARDRAFT_200927 [Jaapia argillacea MUCL 33604]
MNGNVLTSLAAPSPSVPVEGVPAQLPAPAQTIALASTAVAIKSHPTFAKRSVVKLEPITALPSVTQDTGPAQPVPKSQPNFLRRTVVKQVVHLPSPSSQTKVSVPQSDAIALAHPIVARRTIATLPVVAPLSVTSSGVIPAQPVSLPEIDTLTSEVGQHSRPTFLRRVIAKLPVIAPPPPRTNQDVNHPTRMDVDNPGDNVSSENPTKTAPVTFARRKVTNLPHNRTPAPNNAVQGTTDEAMEVDNGRIGSEALAQNDNPTLPQLPEPSMPLDDISPTPHLHRHRKRWAILPTP